MTKTSQKLNLTVEFTENEINALKIYKNYPLILKDDDIIDELTLTLIGRGLLVKITNLYFKEYRINPIIKNFF